MLSADIFPIQYRHELREREHFLIVAIALNLRATADAIIARRRGQ